MQKAFLPSTAPLRRVKRIQFGLLSPEEIVRMTESERLAGVGRARTLTLTPWPGRVRGALATAPRCAQRQMSVCEVTEAEAYEIGRPGVPLACVGRWTAPLAAAPCPAY